MNLNRDQVVLSRLHPTLEGLIALQAVDTATEQARKRLGELPAAEEKAEATVRAAAEELARIKGELKENADRRRTLEKDVAGVDTRLARFEDHKAAVKTNQEYTALLHEIATAKTEKEGLEDQILVLMEAADGLSAALKAAETAHATAQREAASAKTAIVAERGSLTAEMDRLAGERRRETAALPPAVLSKYEQLIRMRRGLGVAQMTGEMCAACHVRLRPPVAQHVRRNEDIVQCESCQRILYYVPPAG